MNLGDLTNLVESSLGSLVEKPLATVSHLVNTPNSAGRYRPFYLRNLLDAVQGRTLEEAVRDKTILITGDRRASARPPRRRSPRPGTVALVARTRENLEKVADEISGAGGAAHVYPATCPTWTPSRPWPIRCSTSSAASMS